MSDWRDPDYKDYRLPSRKELEGSNDFSYSKPLPILRISIAIFTLTILISIIISMPNLISNQDEDNNPILIALEASLQIGNFRTADILTRVYLYDINETTERFLNEKDFEEVGCEKLTYIDNLWKQYSEGRFGLSKQIQIWQDMDKEASSIELGKIEFGKQVGWYDEIQEQWLAMDEIDYSLNARPGHLPTRSPVFGTVDIAGNEYPNELDKAWLFSSFRRSSLSSQCF